MTESGAALERAWALVSAGRSAEARTEIDRGLSTDPENAGLLHVLSIVVEAILSDPAAVPTLGKPGRLAQARRVADAALQLGPDQAISHVAAAKVSLAEGTPQRALGEAERALQLEPNNSVGHQVRGLALQLLGKTKGPATPSSPLPAPNPPRTPVAVFFRKLASGRGREVGFIGAIAAGILIRGGGRGLANLGVPGWLVLVFAVVVIVGYFWWLRRTRRALATNELSDEARRIVEADRKLR